MNKQSLITILLTVIMSMTGANAFAHDIAVANNDGVTIYYVWANKKTELAVSYRGSSYSSYSNEYTGNVVIPKSVDYYGKTYPVTSIGMDAFNFCTDLTSVTIPSSVTSIGISAFRWCSGLTSVTIPNSVTTIGGYAFERSGLTSVIIPSSVTSIGISAFSDCSGLTSIQVESGNIIYDSRNNCNAIIDSNNQLLVGCKNTIIPNSVESIGKSAFSGCTGLTSFTIPNCVTAIGDHAFSGCSGLTSVTIPNSVKTIGSSAFSLCSGLTSLAIPNGVTYIGDEAFSFCSGLTSVTIPNSMESIGNNAFQYCSGLATIASEIKTPFIISNIADNTVTLIVLAGTKAAYQSTAGWNSFMNIVEVGEGGVVGSKFEIDGIYYTIDENETSSPTSANKAISGAVAIPSQVEFNGKKYDVTSIGNSAFSDCKSLISVTIPNSVTSIGESAFRWCSGLTSVTISNSVESIGNNAFYGCSDLTSVIIGSGVLSIGSNAFYNTNIKKTIWLTNTPPSGYNNASGSINLVSNDQFSISNKVVYKSLSSYFVVDGIRYVPVSPSERTCDAIDCLYDENATNVVISSTVTFKGVTMNVKKLNQYLAYNNNYIKTLAVDIDGEVLDYAFAKCSNIQSITLGQKVSAIGSWAFQGCSSFESINIPDIVTVLNEGTFSGCTSLKDIKIKPQMTNINDFVFVNCTSLKRVIIDDCEKTLTLGTNGRNPIFSTCPLDYVYIGRDISYQTSSDYGYSPFYRNTTLREVKITDKETEISENEFYGCTNLQTVTIGDGVTFIGNWAFSGCSSLKYFTYGSKLENIGQEAFSDCTALVQITSKAKAAPTCGSQALEDINKWECILNVPKGYLTVYQAADQWKDFFFMEEEEYMPLQKGDVNSDGNVDKDDLGDLVEYIMGNKPNGVTDESADVNGDHKVDVADVVALVALLK